MPAAQWFDALPKTRCLAEFSLWSANLIALDADLTRVGTLVDIYHIDVSDGAFAPTILYFPDLVAALRKRSDIPFHVHLMVEDPILLAQIDQFAEAGADLISIQAENANATEAIARIKAKGLRAGIVLKVDTPVDQASPFVEDLDFLTLLGTRIGVKGQGLDPTAPGRLHQAKALISARKNCGRCVLAADGGIREDTVPVLVKAGAETVVMGSLAYGAPDLTERINWLHGLK